VATRGPDAAEAWERPEMDRENGGLTYPAICSFSARNEEYFCCFAVDRDGATDDTGTRAVFFAHWGDRLE